MIIINIVPGIINIGFASPILEAPTVRPPIDRFRIRQEYLGQTHKRQAFEIAARSLIQNHDHSPEFHVSLITFWKID